MYKIDIQHLVIISAIEKEGSMTKAASTVHLTQSALSHQLTELEKNIGVQLFERRSKKLWITEAGKKVLASAAVITGELANLERELTTINDETGAVNISTECYTTYSWLPEVVRLFAKEYPQAEVYIKTEASRKPLEFLKEGKIDIAIIGRRHKEKKPANTSMVYSEIFNDRQMVVMHKNNTLAARKLVRAEDLGSQVLFVYDTEDKYIDIIQKVLLPKNIKPSKIIKMPMTEVIIEMIKSNLGIAVMAKWLAQPLMTKDLIMIPLAGDFSKRTWYMATHARRSALQEKFIAFASKVLQEKYRGE